MSQTRRHLLAGSIAATALAPRRACAEAGVTAKHVLFGQAAAFGGPAAALGQWSDPGRSFVAAG